jgi:L-ascorbate metabolism protein UlaG (beta-lactamase superfamily)
MVINWYGESSFKIVSGNLTIVTDPFGSAIGLTAPRFKSDLVLRSKILPDYVSEKNSEARNIFGPGEYEVKGVEIRGHKAGENMVVYSLKIEDMKLGFLGELASKDLSSDALEAVSGADILFIPAGGAPYIDVGEAAALVKKAEPKIVVPSLYKVAGLKRPAGDIAMFEKALGSKSEAQDKLTIKAKDINWEGTRLMILKI